MSDCHSSKLVKARKAHRCECSRHRHGPDREWISRRCEIAKGQTYCIESGIFDGAPFRHRFCLFHRAVAVAIYDRNALANDYEGIDLQELHEYVESGSFHRWARWLAAIRAEYRKLKGSR